MALDIKHELQVYLTGTATDVAELTALVGSRVYADELPEGEVTLPFVFFRRQGSGILGVDELFDPARLQFLCEAATPEAATAVWLALNAALHRRQAFTAGSANVRYSRRQSGPIDQRSSVSGNPQVVAYYIVRY